MMSIELNQKPKKAYVQEIDDLYNQKEWVDWISKYGDDIEYKDDKKKSDGYCLNLTN